MATRIANIFIPVGIYILLLSITKSIGKAGCWMFILMFFAAFQIVLLYLFGRSVIAVDMFLNLVTTNPDEVGELLGNMMPIIITVVILYVPTLALSIFAAIKNWQLPDKFKRRMTKTGYGLIFLGAGSLGVEAIATKHFAPLDDIYPFNVAANIYLAIDRTAKISQYHKTSKDFTYHASSTHDPEEPEIYVAVIGETSRAPQWHIMGYCTAETTTAIDTITGLLPYRFAISESNTTHKSVPLLMSSLDAGTFEDSIYTHKSFITAFKEAGFNTAYISNQAHNHSFIDYFGEEADTTIFLNDNMPLGSHNLDEALVSKIKDLHANQKSKKQLYVLHTYGSHFSYADRYPQSEKHFTPDSPVDVSGKNNKILINAYNNTIAYTAKVLSDIVDFLRTTGNASAIIYTSDHGEDIFDDERSLFLHASPFPSYYQLHVPFIVWMSPRYIETNRDIYVSAIANKTKQLSSSAAYFHTLLSLAGIKTPYHDESKAIVSDKYKLRPTIYLNDHNKGLPLSQSGLLPLDFKAFENAGLKVH